MAFVFGQRRSGDREDGNEYDERQQIPLDRAPHRVRRNQVDHEPRTGRELLRGTVDYARIRLRGVAQCRLLVRRHGREREDQAGHEEPDRDRGDGRGAEEPERARAEPAHAPQVTEARDPGEQRGRDQRDDDHRQEVQEKRRERPEPLRQGEELRRVGQRCGEAEREPRDEARRHPDVDSRRSHRIISGHYDHRRCGASQRLTSGHSSHAIVPPHRRIRSSGRGGCHERVRATPCRRPVRTRARLGGATRPGRVCRRRLRSAGIARARGRARFT